MISFKECRVTGYIRPASYGDVKIRRGLEPEESVGVYPMDFCTQLFYGEVLMSDAWYVIQYFQRLLDVAKGDVLLCGLGLGCAIRALLRMPEVTSVSVLEITPGIIDAVGAYFPKTPIYLGDCLTYDWKDGTMFDTIWNDCWEPGDARYIDYFAKYTPMVSPNGWIGAIEDWTS